MLERAAVSSRRSPAQSEGGADGSARRSRRTSRRRSGSSRWRCSRPARRARSAGSASLRRGRTRRRCAWSASWSWSSLSSSTPAPSPASLPTTPRSDPPSTLSTPTSDLSAFPGAERNTEKRWNGRLRITPRHPEKYLKKGPAYVDGNCTYFAGKDFVDFGSVDWEIEMKKHGITDRSRVLIFFDDHQNELKRIKQALEAGFRHLIFEDNYDTGTGDHYSLRQICDQSYISRGGHSCFKDSDEARIRSKRKKFWYKAVDIDELCGPGEAWWGVRGNMRDNFNHTNTPISHSEHFQNSRFIESILDVYWELPPVAGPSLTHQTRYDPARAPPPIVEDGRYGLFQRLGLTKLDKSVFKGYTQMVYVAISRQ